MTILDRLLFPKWSRPQKAQEAYDFFRKQAQSTS
jgi:hypothetical protein